MILGKINSWKTLETTLEKAEDDSLEKVVCSGAILLYIRLDGR